MKRKIAILALSFLVFGPGSWAKKLLPRGPDCSGVDQTLVNKAADSIKKKFGSKTKIEQIHWHQIWSFEKAERLRAKISR